MEIPTVYLNSPQLNRVNQPCFLPQRITMDEKGTQAAVSLLLIIRAQCLQQLTIKLMRMREFEETQRVLIFSLKFLQTFCETPVIK